MFLPVQPMLSTVFGGAVATSGDRIAFSTVPYAGLRPEEFAMASRGEVEIRELNPTTGLFSLRTVLHAPDSGPGDGFGRALAFDGDTLVVSSVGVEPRGRAHVYQNIRSEWRRVSTLEALFPPADLGHDRFGASIALGGDRLVVGCPGDATNGASSGCVYVFHRQDEAWNIESILLPSDSASLDRFGSSVAIDGDVIVVGCRLPYLSERRPTVYVYRRHSANGAWLEEGQLRHSDADAASGFGCTVSASSGRIAIGSIRIAGPMLFRYRPVAKDWRHETTFQIDGPSVGLRENRLAVGAPAPLHSETADAFATGGAMHLFELRGNRWIRVARAEPSVPAPFAQFGAAMSLGDRWWVAGAPGHGESERLGRAYLFSGPHDENGDGMLDICEDACPADLDRSGVVDYGDVVYVTLRLGALWPYDGGADLDRDGVVDLEDIAYVLVRLGAMCDRSQH